MSSEFYDIANIGNSPPIPSPPLPDYRNLYLSEAKLFLPRPLALPPPLPLARLYEDDRCRAATDRFHPPRVFPSYFSTILRGGGQRKTILNLREASRGSGRMDDRSSGDIDSNRSPKTILFPSHPANDQSANETSQPFSFRGTGRDRERKRGNEGNGSTRCLYQFLRLRPRWRGNLCNKGSRRAEGGRGVISPFKAAPLPLPARLAFR